MQTSKVAGSIALTSVAFATLALFGTAGCSSPASSSDGNTTTTSSSTTATETGSTTVDTSETETSTETDTSDATTDNSSSSGSFYGLPDEDIHFSNDCDPWIQDCPDGEKCVPYASTGGTWDANKCVPILGADQPGEPCVGSNPIEATDSCDASGICWAIDLGQGEPVELCTAFCTGQPDAPICADNQQCVIRNDGSINLCFDVCDPLLQDCGDGLGCAWSELNGVFECMQTSDVPVGGGCLAANACEVGSQCVFADLVPNCMDPEACCAEFCSVATPTCMQAGTECIPFFTVDPPAGYEDVGLCVVPGP